jgi:hypothetical protein
MSQRTITDTSNRVWVCDEVDAAGVASDVEARNGQDVRLSCTTASVEGPISVTVGWNWKTISPNGLARMIAAASPVSRR